MDDSPTDQSALHIIKCIKVDTNDGLPAKIIQNEEHEPFIVSDEKVPKSIRHMIQILFFITIDKNKRIIELLKLYK